MAKVQALRIQDLVRDEAQFLQLQALMQAEGWTSRIATMSWAEFQRVPHVGQIIEATAQAVTAKKQ